MKRCAQLCLLAPRMTHPLLPSAPVAGWESCGCVRQGKLSYCSLGIDPFSFDSFPFLLSRRNVSYFRSSSTVEFVLLVRRTVTTTIQRRSVPQVAICDNFLIAPSNAAHTLAVLGVCQYRTKRVN